ncbi:unnamed protein product [Rotaria sp. Silwood1]|nr:unnamed protein product [Rotaria sp. Silwood1]CAF0842392.1 unnamed protein product [Rotaria sp. Silwood1]CAF3364167.1 unnamed protein product [Rotaria sp. Silwood1]CAF3364803.1 unnamed protein product [Rotaria sp. Silwood1]CAF4738472.1 unnamed protein product [Rotaria sp. Silwood1]
MDSRILSAIPEVDHLEEQEEDHTEEEEEDHTEEEEEEEEREEDINNNYDHNNIQQINNQHYSQTISSSSSLLLKTDQINSQSSSTSSYLSSSNSPDRILNQKFHIAALTGNLNLLQELLTKSRVPVDCRDKENSTALLLACARGHYTCADYLLANGADPNARRITGASPLYFAASYRHTRIVELLLSKYKAIVDLSTFDGSTPLHVSCERGFTDVVQLLINSQANINAKMNDGTTAIMLACQNGHLSLVQMLISTGKCNVSIQRLDGVTPLFLIVQYGQEKIFDYFIDNIDNIEDFIDLAREDGATPLFKACQKDYDSLVNKIIKFKPNIGLLKNGESCLHAATMFNHASIVRTLIDNGANPLLNNWEGMTAVDLAKEAQLKDILDILMKSLATKLSEHGRQYLLHKSTRRSDADFNLELIENEDDDEWKLYKSLKSAAELERFEEEIEQIPILPSLPTIKGKQTNTMRQTLANKPHRYHSTPIS